jgi:PKD repeat protein
MMKRVCIPHLARLSALVGVLLFRPEQSVVAAPGAQFNSPLPTPPPNDNFNRARKINAIPYSAGVDLTYATRQANERIPSCANNNFSAIDRTVWYSFTPAVNTVLTVRANGDHAFMGFYTGGGLNKLIEQNCFTVYGSSEISFFFGAGTTYSLQIGAEANYNNFVSLELRNAPPPSVNIGLNPSEPSTYDDINFWDSSWDSAGQNFVAWSWNFGDGAESTAQSVTHRYATDGDYTVTHSATTADGRTGVITQILNVRTHDVSITKIARPAKATVGETKRVVISVLSGAYPETVNVQLYKSEPNGYRQIGYLEQFVDVKPDGAPTEFRLSYTYTKEDAAMGKVLFKAYANPVNVREAFPPDNEFISFAVKVSPAPGGGFVAGAALDDLSEFVTDDVSNVAETLAVSEEAISEEALPFVSFLPLVSGQ